MSNDNSVVPDGYGSSYLNSLISSYADLVYYTKTLLGYPVTPIELTDAQWATFVDEAITKWTQFGGGMKEEYLVFCSNMYERGCGVKLDELLSVGCNDQHCYQTVTYESITSTRMECSDLGTSTAYLSVSPFTYPTNYNYLDPYSVSFSGISGQNIYLYFDPKNPWNMNNVCNADCVTINPVSSQWYNLSANPRLSGINFDFNDETLSSLVSSISSYIDGYNLSSVPLTALGEGTSYIPISYFNLSAFYHTDIDFGPPLEACVNIGKGSGYIYPNCNTSLINPCSALSTQYKISSKWPYVIANLTLSSITIPTSSVGFNAVSSFFANYCNECNCNCALLSTYEESTFSYTYKLYRNTCFTWEGLEVSQDPSFTWESMEQSNIYNSSWENIENDCCHTPIYLDAFVLSGYDGKVWDLGSTDISKATHVKLFDVPTCTTDGSIPLNSNDGILGTFTLCNTALNTNGSMFMDEVQFFKDFKPPIEALYDNKCGWSNNGFTMTNYISSYSDCIRTTPAKIKVDVSFCKKNIITSVGIVSSYLSGNVDSAINRKRKVTGIFSIDPGSSAGYGGFGGDLLFNFDYALMANTFGFDLNGTRTAMASRGYDLLTYHMAKSFVENSKKILRNVSYTFDNKTQYLKVIPEPPLNFMKGSNYDSCGCAGGMGSFGGGLQCYIVGAYVEPSIRDCITEPWIQDWVLARSMWTLGRIRSKYSGVTLYGGAQIAGEQLVSEGQAKMDQLLKELRNDGMWVAPPLFFIG